MPIGKRNRPDSNDTVSAVCPYYQLPNFRARENGGPQHATKIDIQLVDEQSARNGIYDTLGFLDRSSFHALSPGFRIDFFTPYRLPQTYVLSEI